MPLTRFTTLPLSILLLLTGCAGNVRNIPARFDPAESVVVGYIKTVPVLWDFLLYDEQGKKSDAVEIAGKGYGLTKAGRLQHEGYVFKMIRPGTYRLRLRKFMVDRYVHDDILRLDIPPGTLVYFGTVKVVIDRVMVDPPQPDPGRSTRMSMMFKYHFIGIDEDETLNRFARQYPSVFASYRHRIVRIHSPAPPRNYISLPAPFRLAAHTPLTPGDQTSPAIPVREVPQ